MIWMLVRGAWLPRAFFLDRRSFEHLTSLPLHFVFLFCCCYLIFFIIICIFYLFTSTLTRVQTRWFGIPFQYNVAVDEFPTRQVVQPLWLSDDGDGLCVFEHTAEMFDKYLIQRKLYDAWQIGLVLAEAMNMESFYWITPLRAKDVRNTLLCLSSLTHHKATHKLPDLRYVYGVVNKTSSIGLMWL